jgi:hypothetical protein
MCLHIAVALEIVAGQMWATLQTDQVGGSHCPGGTAHAACVRGTAPAASRLSLHACSGGRIASAQADLESSPQDRRQRHPSESRRGGNRGLDSVARVTPPGNLTPRAAPCRGHNLMPRAALRRLQPSLARARARAERGAGPQWGNPGRSLGAGGLTSKPTPYGHCILGAALQG